MRKLNTISIIIPCHNNSSILELVLLAIKSQTSQPEEIICVDDGSKCSEKRLIQHLCKSFNTLFCELPSRNDSFGRRSHARNLGTRKAQGDICLYLDGDMLLSPNYIGEIRRLHSLDHKIMIKGLRYSINQNEQIKGNGFCIDIIRNNPPKPLVDEDIYRINDFSLMRSTNSNLAIVSPILLTLAKKKFSRRNFLYFIGALTPAFYFSPNSIEKDVLFYSNRWDYCASNNLSVRKINVRNIGFWDENFLGWGEEDIDFAFRLFCSGIKPVLPQKGHIYAYHLDHSINESINSVSFEKNAKYLIKKYPIMKELRNDVYKHYSLII